MKPIISTITPCYKMKPYLKGFLDELPSQTIFNQIEIVLDHNDPDEEELSWVKDFCDKYPGRLKHIVTSPVQPIGTSMNTCIKESSADLLTIWNVDDRRTENSLELQVATFNDGADIVYGDFIMVRKFGENTGKLYDASDYKHTPEELTRSMILGPYMAFRKSLCEKAGFFDEQLKSGADFDLAVRLGFHGKAKTTDGLLGYYLNEGKGASTRPDSKQQLEATVIELRYGIYDKIDYGLVPQALKYDVSHIYQNGVPVPVSSFVPEYAVIMDERLRRWKDVGIRKFVLGYFLKFKKTKLVIKKYLLQK